MKTDRLRASELTNEALCQLFVTEGLDAQLDDNGDVRVKAPSGNVAYVEVVDAFSVYEEGRDLPLIHFYAGYRIPESNENACYAFCNRVNAAGRLATAFCPKPGALRLSAALPAAGGIGKHTITTALAQFQMVDDTIREFDEDNILGHGSAES